MRNEEVDQILKEALLIKENPSEELNQSLKKKMEERNMKKHFVKKILVASLSATLILGGVVYAATTGGYSIMTSNPETEQTDYAKMNEIVKDAGFAFKSVAKIGDFKFYRGEVSGSQDYDENGNTTSTGVTKSPNLIYKNKDGKKLNLTITNGTTALDNEKNVKTYEGISYSYQSHLMKLVPPDYDMSEEEKEEEASEEVWYVTSDGQETMEERTAINMIWVYDGVSYDMSTMDVELSEEEMIDFMEEIVNA